MGNQPFVGDGESKDDQWPVRANISRVGQGRWRGKKKRLRQPPMSAYQPTNHTAIPPTSATVNW
ncbi:hypothetical protein M0657_004685 [Pyricularia oryzae]|uniref:Uncharacterized protein n=1 Tax=Pyricularia oryzae TaxID=318829 RepID=A0A4V1C5H7_PYROR|nr:hypothetical protein M9X92_005085 [Pyricularia oryzae]KAI7924340.1 hypothetical protein M0657_004685 [Pyricularia oryzae]QBZ56425.1 hypothetical protein PoMZ_01331 [Pyricularia oryzae]